MGRDDVDLEPVDLIELGLLGLGRSGHARQLVVHPEVVLNGDGGEGLGLSLDLHSFLGLHRLMQSVGPAPAGHDPAGELVHDHHLAFLHQVIHFLLVQHVRLQQLVDDVELLALDGVVGFDLPAPLDPFVRGEIRVPVDRVDLLRDVRAPGTVRARSGDMASDPRSVRWTECPFSSSTK